mgnify:CR=1 FL=1
MDKRPNIKKRIALELFRSIKKLRENSPCVRNFFFPPQSFSFPPTTRIPDFLCPFLQKLLPHIPSGTL